MYIHSHIYIISIHIHIYIYSHIYSHLYSHFFLIYSHIFTYILTYIHIYIYIYSHIFTYIHIYILGVSWGIWNRSSGWMSVQQVLQWFGVLKKIGQVPQDFESHLAPTFSKPTHPTPGYPLQGSYKHHGFSLIGCKSCTSLPHLAKCFNDPLKLQEIPSGNQTWQWTIHDF